MSFENVKRYFENVDLGDWLSAYLWKNWRNSLIMPGGWMSVKIGL